MALAEKLYKARVETAKSLPCRLADAIPSLRVVAIADGQSDLDYDGTPPFASPRGANLDKPKVTRPPIRGPRDNMDEYTNQNMWCIMPVLALEWWRIVRDGDEVVRMDALTAAQGNEMQRFFEESDLETLDLAVEQFVAEL